jgi:hypothetical protein
MAELTPLAHESRAAAVRAVDALWPAAMQAA